MTALAPVGGADVRLRDRIDVPGVRAILGVGFVGSMIGAALPFVFAAGASPATQWLLAGGAMLLASVFGVLGFFAHRLSIRSVITLLTWSSSVLVFATLVARGEGVNGVAFAFNAILICVATVVGGARTGAALALLCVAGVLAMTYAEQVGALPGVRASMALPLGLVLTTQFFLVAISIASGVVVAGVAAGHRRDAHVRERRYRALFEQSPVGLLVHRDGQLLEANGEAARLFDLDPTGSGDAGGASASALGRATLEAVFTHARACADAPAGTEVPTADIELADEAGGTRVLRVSAVRVVTAGGLATMSHVVDDSARHAAEASSRKARALLSNLFAASADCVILTEFETGIVRMANPGFERLTGYRVADVLGRSILEIGLWQEEADRKAFAQAVATTGHAYHLVSDLMRADGVVLRAELSANRFTFESTAYIVSVVRDVTRRELARLEQQAILTSASLGIVLTREGIVTRANEAAETMFGMARGSLEGTNSTDLWVDPASASSQRWERAYAALKERGQLDFERELKRVDGSTFWCRMRGRGVDPRDPARAGVVWVLEDVTERRRMERALSDARDAAEAASRARSAFLANVSHEIRTPLNGLVGLARLAVKPDLASPLRDRHLAQILESSENLAEIMGAILDMSKIESGKLQLEEIVFDVRELLQAVHSAYAPRARSRGLGWSLAVAPDVGARVLGDPVRTRQLVANYLANALKFTPNGAVELAAQRMPDGVLRIEVRDTGIGVQPDTLPKLFKTFSQVDDSSTRSYGGAGLGLSLCRELAELMGGRVGVESTPGVGSTFWAELPLAEAPQAAQAEAAPHERDAQPEATGGREALVGLRVLVAEDNPVNMLIVGMMLQEWGIDVREAGDGAAALVAVQAARDEGRPIDVVLMDVQMPNVDGITAARVLRERYDAWALPIVALTAGALPAEQEAALECGMNAFLTKPIDEGALARTLATVARGRRR